MNRRTKLELPARQVSTEAVGNSAFRVGQASRLSQIKPLQRDKQMQAGATPVLRRGARPTIGCSMLVPSSRPSRPASRITHHAQRGVALVITLILLSVITFLAITFLAVARRERGSVTVSTEQKVATFAAETALERAKAEITATILASTNSFSFDLLISTNFENLIGFDPAAQPQASPNVTNVNFDYTITGGALNGNQALQNLANLMFNPRPPVVVTNRLYGSNEFRFYVDLNRDGQFTRTGLLIVTNQNGLFYTTDGGVIPPVQPAPPNTLSNWFTGDPQFIGILERPEFPHSPSNKFVARYAFIVVPAGKTLDVNYIHNHAKPTPRVQDGFYRNQGVGSWEINLAAFLADLNTNVWGGPNSLILYQYETNRNSQSRGLAFQDAASVTKYRYGYDVTQLNSVQGLYGGPNGPGDRAFRLDGFDGYSAGPLLMGLNAIAGDPDVILGVRTAQPWSGAPNTNHFFTTQDMFDRTKTGIGAGGGNAFVDRLIAAQNFSPSSYDRNTFYRMVAQLGTDSAPDPEEKLNVNYINVGGWKSTNFVSWNDSRVRNGDASLGILPMNRPGSEVFFINAADRLLRRYSAEWAARNPQEYQNTFGMFQTQGSNNIPIPFSVTNIPVLVNGRFAYTPAIHRLLQLSANLWDASNATNFPGSSNAMPTVFRPRFKMVGGDVYIADFIEQGVFDPTEIGPLPLDLSFSNSLQRFRSDGLSLIFGVPMVIGARKGLPNFNEFASESVVQITRKLELRKSAPGGSHLIYQTNQMFIIGISNAFGAEFWNSYTANYARSVEVVVTNYSLVELTNDYRGLVLRTNLTAGERFVTSSTGPNAWSRWTAKPPGKDASLLVPLRTNHSIVPESTWSQVSLAFLPLTDRFEVTPSSPVPLPFPRWGLTITNRVVAYIRDVNTRRLLDYVQLSSMTGYRDITGEMAVPATVQGFDGVWGTNILNGYVSGGPGVIQQIEISKGNPNGSSTEWQSYGINLPGGATRAQEIAKFLAFMSPNNQANFTDPDTGIRYDATSTNLVAIAPFSPTWKQSLPMLWQANDPLIHYTSGDMEFLERSLVPVQWVPVSGTNVPTMGNLGVVNERYRPWGGNPFQVGDPNAYNLVVKDPGVRSSSDWAFPTNKLATLGWLGRVHRGSPWQTIYLKATAVPDAVNAGLMKADAWRKWAGNRLIFDAESTQPEMDRALFDVFTTALNENASRGQLPINQTNLAAWSAVFSGMVAITNSSSEDDLLVNLTPRFEPWIVDPAGAYGVYDPLNPGAYPAVAKIVAGINRERTRTRTVTVNGTNTKVFVHKNGTFNRLGDILAVPQLTLDPLDLDPNRPASQRTNSSPFLNLVLVDPIGENAQTKLGLNDPVIEWLPQQMMSLVKLGEPRFVVYAYGQGLKPAPNAVLTSSFGGPNYFGMVTNYQITAEVVMRAVVRLEGAPENPRAVVESYNVLGPD